jgi:hypothetical protein
MEINILVDVLIMAFNHGTGHHLTKPDQQQQPQQPQKVLELQSWLTRKELAEKRLLALTKKLDCLKNGFSRNIIVSQNSSDAPKN